MASSPLSPLVPVYRGTGEAGKCRALGTVQVLMKALLAKEHASSCSDELIATYLSLVAADSPSRNRPCVLRDVKPVPRRSAHKYKEQGNDTNQDEHKIYEHP